MNLEKGQYFILPHPCKVIEIEKKRRKKAIAEDGVKRQFTRLKILIVEDDATSELLITQLVDRFSKNTLIAKNGSDAITICRKNPDIDLVLMDIQLPGISGYKVTSQIRQFNRDVVIIAQTAFALSGDKEKALRAGCNDYITKPLNNFLVEQLIGKYFQ